MKSRILFVPLEIIDNVLNLIETQASFLLCDLIYPQDLSLKGGTVKN